MIEEILILHLSDLHFGKFNPYTGQILVLKEIWGELKKRLKENEIDLNNIDLLIITGDISSVASKSDFDYAKEFLEEIIFKDIEKERSVIIPGNHDLEFSSNEGDININRFDKYLKFKEELGYNDEITNSADYINNPHYIKSFKEISTLILGLNSCLYTAYNIDENHPSDLGRARFSEGKKYFSKINENQLKECLTSNNSYLKYDFKIALLHHNILAYRDGKAFLSNFYKIVNEISKEEYCFNIILHGHLHKKIIDIYQNCITIGAGSFGVRKENKDVLNQINIIRLRKDDNIIPITWVEVLPISIDYEEKPEYSITIPQNWIEETLEMPTSIYLAMSTSLKTIKSAIEESDFKLALENMNNLTYMLYETKIENKKKAMKKLGHTLYNIVKDLKEDKILVNPSFIDFIEQLTELRKTSFKPSRGHIFAWSPLRVLMRKAGAQFVTKEAVDQLMEYIERTTLETTNTALELSRHAHRKKLIFEDLDFAIELSKK